MTSTVEPPLRTCRTCGNVERNIHYRCSNCGRDYAADPPRFSRRQKLTAAVVAGVVVLVGLAIAIPLLLTSKSEHVAKQTAADRAAAARKAASLRVAQRPVSGRLAVRADSASTSARNAQVVAFEAAITRDAPAPGGAVAHHGLGPRDAVRTARVGRAARRRAGHRQARRPIRLRRRPARR